MLIQILGAFVAIYAFSMVIEVPKRFLPFCGLIGAVGWLLYLMVEAPYGILAGNFVGALGIALISHIFARGFKAPVTVFLIPGILVLVPGAALYRSIYQFFLGTRSMGSFYLMQTIQIAGLIALAIFITDSFFAILQKHGRKRGRILAMLLMTALLTENLSMSALAAEPVSEDRMAAAPDQVLDNEATAAPESETKTMVQESEAETMATETVTETENVAPESAAETERESETVSETETVAPESAKEPESETTIETEQEVWQENETATAKASGIVVNATNFPDAAFRDYILDYIAGEDGVLQAEEIANKTKMELYYDGISSLKGIEYFTSLKILYIPGNNLTSLDVRKLTKLEQLDCSNNKLTSLSVSGLSKLKRLDCSDNNLKKVTFQSLPAMTELDCGKNYLTALDVRSLSALQYLVCSVNEIRSLNLSGMPNLYNVDCEGNAMTSLNVSNLPALAILLCGSNSLTKLDTSTAPALRTLYCYVNSLASLDLTANKSMVELEAFSNKLTTMNLSGLTNLISVNCNDNKISTLDVKAASVLNRLTADNNRIAGIDLSGNTMLVTSSFLNQKLSATVVSRDGKYYADLTIDGFSKNRISQLSSGKTCSTGIYWTAYPEAKSVSYQYDTGRNAGKVYVTVSLTSLNTAPKAPTVGKVSWKSLKNVSKKKAALSWKKVSGATGYYLYYGRKSNMKGAKKVKVTAAKKTIKNLKKGKTYYFKIRAYKVQNGKTYYGKYSTKKKLKIRK